MEIDFSSLWTWTVPLWSLVVLVAYLVGSLTQDVVIPAITGSAPVPTATAPTATAPAGQGQGQDQQGGSRKHK